ncbi:hypothetical protein HSX11_07370 [Oxalobacteraceae bacterium]|nr:hypothetical protein [Oxalobacteraceae bacterium]
MGILDEVLEGIHQVPFLGESISRLAINQVAARTVPRPRAYSLWSADPVGEGAIGPITDYTSWPGLTDRSFSGRHLPPMDQASADALPSLDAVAALYQRNGDMKTGRSSVLFMFFAQWFTDSVLRIDPRDRRRNTSNHDIDLCQIYGLNEETCNLLRSHAGGQLKHQIINGESYLPYLFDKAANGELTVKPEFAAMPYAASVDAVFDGVPAERKAKAYATGLERGNSTIGYVAISTLFMREHNRIATELAQRNPDWGDERLFQTARLINIVLLLKVVVEDYINHIAGTDVFRLDHSFAEKEKWYRQNWIAVEFDLLYRWHSLVPDAIEVKGQMVNNYRNNNVLVEELGLAGVLNTASRQPAGKIGLFNSPDFLAQAERNALNMSRKFRLASFNDYRVRFGMERLESIDDLSDDEHVRNTVSALYGGDVNKVEFLVGLFAEKGDDDALFGGLLNVMVAYDAFTQIFTNPLLSKNIYNAQTFSQYGLDLIKQTTSVQDIANRNAEGATASLSAEAED